MSGLSTLFANLPPDKRAKVLDRLRASSGKKSADGTITDYSKNFEYCFRSEMPFDFSVRQTEVLDPGPGCVQVRAKASSLNFRDVLIASRQYPVSPGVPTNMGSDFSGIVEKVGEGVTTFRPGDEVIALHVGHVEPGGIRNNCHFMKQFNIFEDCVCRKPANLSFEAAACIPTVSLTAYIALVELAGLKRNEKVLIHMATGGVGLSAVQIAKWLGAEIYATAGTLEKRQFLLDHGIKQVYDSRSSAFAGAIRSAGIQMNVVLNSLAGDLMTESMKLLHPFGRFIHIDKKDVSASFLLPMSLFVNGISFQFLDISLLVKEPALMKKSLEKIVGLFESGEIKPIQHKVFPASQLKDAITALSRGTHIGKMVILYD